MWEERIRLLELEVARLSKELDNMRPATDEIRCKKLTIVDHAGRPLMTLGHDLRLAPSISLIDLHGTARVELKLEPDGGPTLHFRSANGEDCLNVQEDEPDSIRIDIRRDSRSQAIYMTNSSGEVQTSLGNIGLYLMGEGGDLRAGFSTYQHPHIAFHGPSGHYQVYIALADREPRLSFRRDDGSEIRSMP